MLTELQGFGSDTERVRFELLYERYKGMMFRIASAFFPDQQDAEDAVHQSFLRIIEHLDRIGTADSPETRSYITAVCRTCSIDLLRKKRRETPTDAAEFFEADPPPYPGEDPLADAFGRLAPQDRELLLMRYHLGYRNAEIAGKLHIRNDAVRKRLQYARARLKALLEEADENAEK